MTQTTIKEKIEKLLSKNKFEIGSYPYVVFDKDMLPKFARLICNELNQFGKDTEVGIDLREKTEEILKALK